MAIDPSASSVALSVLAVEDDAAVAYAIVTVLGCDACDVTPEGSVDEAFATIARHPRAFDVTCLEAAGVIFSAAYAQVAMEER